MTTSPGFRCSVSAHDDPVPCSNISDGITDFQRVVTLSPVHCTV